MKAFGRIFKYVWPQWPRLTAVVLSAVVVGVLFSLSFMTVIPLLKVMMNEEGIHGWVDRSIAKNRYGMDFELPAYSDFNVGDQTLAYYLRVREVEPEGAAEKAGFQVGDIILVLGRELYDPNKPGVARGILLKELATIDGPENVAVQVGRLEADGVSTKDIELILVAGKKPGYVNALQWVVSFVPKEQTGSDKEKAMLFIISLMVVVTFIRCGATFIQKYLVEKVVHISAAKLREDAFAHAMVMPVGFFSSEGTSDTVSRLIGDINAIARGVKVLLGKTLREPLKAIFCLICAMAINYKLVLIFLGAAPFTIGLMAMFGKKMKKAAKRSLASSAKMLGKLGGAIGALRVVKVYNRQEYETESFHLINRRYLRQVLRMGRIDSATGPIMESLGMIAGSAALMVGVHWIVNGGMNPSSFFTLLILLGSAAESVRKTSDIWNSVQTGNAAAERVFDVIDQPVEIEKPGAYALPGLKDMVEFKNVVFSYPRVDKPTLNGIDLKVQAGHNVAIVGPNGSGKTTLVNLIPRFYDIDSGSIVIDGHDINDVTLKSLRDQIGMVTQNVVTFNDTIAANIAYSNSDATKEQIISAAKRAFAHEFIEPLPKGYDTVIGEHGAGLSGGQLQRIVIARAILKDPEILIFDEATSQVDADSEAKIHTAIEEIMADRTSFIIAHRFSTVVNADVIVVMDKGRIVSQGPHNELIKSCRLYQSLYETQLVRS